MFRDGASDSNLDVNTLSSASTSSGMDSAQIFQRWQDGSLSIATGHTDDQTRATASSSPMDIANKPRRHTNGSLQRTIAEAAAAFEATSTTTTAVQQPPARSRSVSVGKHFTIPKVEIASDGNVKYLVELKEPGKQARLKWTRFSSFHALKDRIKLALPRRLAAQFPKRYWKWFVNHSTNKFVENRRAALETWLQEAVDALTAHSHLNTSHSSYFREWLNKFEWQS